MSRKRAEKIETAATSFARWRLMLGLTQDEAAAKLQKSRRAIQAYERPDPKTGRPAVPDYPARVVMDMMAKGETIPQPWPE
jgi:DNA-binding XRE family transcriptional regulator